MGETEDMLPRSGSGVSPLHFTGRQDDSDTGLALFASRMALRDDYFGARYDSSSLARFITLDERFVDQFPDDPRSLNLYTYVMNNPVTSVDVFGHCTTPGPNACGPTPPPAKSVKLASPQAHTHSPLKQGVKGWLKVALGLGLIGTAVFGDAPGGALGAVS